MLILNEDDVQELLPMSECVNLLDNLFKEWLVGSVSNMDRYRLPLQNGSMQLMAGMSSELQFCGLKTYVTGTGSTSRMSVLLYDISTARPVALLAANALGAIRTGAASGVATRHMARDSAHTVAIIGSGSQAQTQLEAVCAVRNIERVLVYSRTTEHRKNFSSRMQAELNIEVQPVDSPEQAIEQAEIICTITNSRNPVFDGANLQSGVHINAAGSNNWIRREIDDSTIQKCDLVVVDSISDAQNECGELIWAAERRVFRWESAVELRDIVGGRVAGRPSFDAITLFESQGLAIEDIAAGAYVYERAKERGMGHSVDL